jgi:hypothetical protein
VSVRMTDDQREVYEYVKRCIVRSQTSFMERKGTDVSNELKQRHAGAEAMILGVRSTLAFERWARGEDLNLEIDGDGRYVDAETNRFERCWIEAWERGRTCRTVPLSEPSP